MQIWYCCFKSWYLGFRRILFRILAVLCVVLFSFSALPVQASGLNGAGQVIADQVIPTIVNADGLMLPDWDNISFSNFPEMLEGGSIQFPPEITQMLGFNPSVVWEAGAKVSDILKVGMVQELGLQDLSLAGIDQITGNVSDLLPLSDFGTFSVQSMGSLVEAIPGLSALPIGEVAPVLSLVQQFWGQDLSSIFTPANLGGALSELTPIGDLLQQFPDIASLDFTNLDLSSFDIASVPGLDEVPLDKLKGWQDSVMGEVPGLDKVPFSKMAKFAKEGIDPFIVNMDVPLDGIEASRSRTVSGSFQAGYQVPCDKNCEHMELTPIGGSQMDVMGTGLFANGKSWISGKTQLVEGGYGVLKAVSGGMEPTGRNPYGGVFKQVLISVDQAKGEAQTAMFFRYCHHGIPELGCTPYILGPVPFLKYSEEQMVFLGVALPQDDGKGLSLPGGGSPSRGGNGVNACSATMSGDAVDRAIAVVDELAARGGRWATSSSHAAEHIPRIMAALKAEGITCPAQVAYVLATVNGETSWVNFNEGAEGAYDYTSAGQSAHGRGYLQTTWSEGYDRVQAEFGVDVVSNPDLLATDYDLMAKVLARGFKQGWYGTRRTIDEAIPCDGQVDYEQARWMINDADAAAEFASAATTYYEALSSGGDLANATTQEKAGCGGGAMSGSPPKDGWYDPAPGATETGPWGQYIHAGHFHHGEDLAADYGTPIYAAADGVVDGVNTGCGEGYPGDYCGSGYGNWVSIKHDNGYYTFYGHNQRPTVSAGQRVKGGEQIAEMGSTGSSTGSHTHFEVCSSPCGYSNGEAASVIGIPHPFSGACSGNNPGAPAYCESW
jgi:hypothetical protein